MSRFERWSRRKLANQDHGDGDEIAVGLEAENTGFESRGEYSDQSRIEDHDQPLGTSPASGPDTLVRNPPRMIPRPVASTKPFPIPIPCPPAVTSRPSSSRVSAAGYVVAPCVASLQVIITAFATGLMTMIMIIARSSSRLPAKWLSACASGPVPSTRPKQTKASMRH